MCEKKGQILFTVKSPYMVADVKDVSYDGEKKELPRVTALCRCGESKNMPYCDGSHAKVNFSGEKERASGKGSVKAYTGNDITIYFNAKICAHVGRCLKLEGVFSNLKKPWINPDGDSVENIISTIEKCPSGALSYQIQGEELVKAFGQSEKIKIKKGGPLCVEGGLSLVDTLDSEKELESREHYTLCRCGKSKNKPFCDGMHHEVGFDK